MLKIRTQYPAFLLASDLQNEAIFIHLPVNSGSEEHVRKHLIIVDEESDFVRVIVGREEVDVIQITSRR
ncbi:hypothetical protein HanRHA438_Chr08g0351451 [Helianthus annuus]|nr:hypothetical protein HanIR_Chr08g0367241 [Helianthus annuus]KAJ0897960.1 hypothetical protein HanRHA438_Chr08g0351451 [Helianthus annuus]